MPGNRLWELSLTRSMHLCSSVREMRTLLLPPTQCPWQRGQGEGRQRCCHVRTWKCKALGSGGISGLPCLEGATARIPLRPCYVLLSCHSAVIALHWLPKIKGLSWLSSSRFVSKHKAKEVHLSNMPGEDVQCPGKHHRGLGVFPQLVLDPCHRMKGWIWPSQTHCAAQRKGGMKLIPDSPDSFWLKEAVGVHHLL